MIDSKNLTLYKAIENAAKSVPNDVAIYYFNTKITFAKLLSLIDIWASILQNDFNIKKGDSVIIALPNIPQVIILFYAINKIGGICNMVHPYTPKEGMQQYYTESNCKLAFLFDKRVYKELKEYKAFEGNIVICDAQTYFKPDMKVIYDVITKKLHKELQKNTKFTFYREFKDNGLQPIEKVIFDNEVSVLLHSASTTGIAKTIKLSARSFNFTAARYPEMYCVKPEEFLGKAMISVLPSFHGFGLCTTMHCPLANRFAVVLIPKYSPKEVARMMNKVKCVITMCGVPTIYKTLLNERSFIKNRYLRELESCFSGGDSLPTHVKENFDALMIKNHSKCRLFEGYGLTETLSVSCVNTHRRHKFGSIGYPISDVDVKILDENNNELEPGVVGEIAIKSENTMLGYFNNDEATKATYFNGYLKTGDLGYLDEDGFLFFNSRKKRVIKVSGVAVFPHQIEEVISHIPGVKGVCAIQIPDEKLTNAVKVFVVYDKKNPEVILEECRRMLISWSIPKEVEFVDKLPYTKYKKVNFAKLQLEEDKKRGLAK